MAKTVGDLLIKLGVDGIEGVNVLKSSLTALGKAAGPTDKNIRKIRTEILEFANAGQKSTQAIRGVIESFKGLQAQASINSGIYKQLSADIEGLEDTLQSLIPDANKAATAMERLSSIGFPSRVPDAFEKNMKVRRQQLQGLRVDSEDYLNTLVGIRNFEAQQAARVARQEVSAAARVARTGMPTSIVQADQPATIAALRLRIGEVQNEIENLDFTTQDYAEANKELIALQKSLSQALNGTSSSFDSLGEAQTRAARRAEKLAGIQAAQAGAPGTRDPRTGAMIAGGSAVASLVQQPVRQVSGLYQSIGDIGMAGISADIDRMGKSYQEVANDIRNATFASNGSINSLQAQRASWAQLQAGLSPASKAYRDVGREIDKVDRRLQKLNRRRKPTFGGAASALGGIAAGGVFGGPEGALGAAVGGAFGGIQGVAAGAALGAQVKMLREALGATSDYAAELQKLRIALQGATKVEGNAALSKANFEQATKAAAEATRNLNVPQDVAIRGMTKLTAAVIGAKGNVTDAEIVFRNVTAAIKATGGGAQDVESAITAMVQTFSKGKVSAEELSGQLGERLPGAVTQFAEANKMTLPELQKAFKAGTVGLNELMTFIVSLGPEYAETAKKIAESSADAGARAQVAFNEVRIAVGESLQPIGAQLQIAFAEFVTDILPALVGAATAAAGAIRQLLDFAALLVANFEELASAALVLGTAVGAAGLAKAAITAGGAMNVLRLALFDVRLAVAGLGKALAFLAANPIVLLVAGVTAAGVALYRAATANDRFVKSIDDGNVTLDEAKEKTEDVYDKIGDLQERLDKTSNKRMIQSLRRQMRNLYDDAADLEAAMERALFRDFGAPKGTVTVFAPGMSYADELPRPKRTKFDELEGDGDGKGKTPMGEIELALRRQMRGAIAAEDEILKAHLQLALDLTAAREETEDVNKRINMEEQAYADFALAKKKILEDQNKELEEQGKLLQQAGRELADARYAVTLMSQEERQRIEINRQLAEFAEKYAEAMSSEELAEALRELRANLEEANSASFKFKQGLREVFDGAMNVTEAVGEVGVNAVKNLGDAFADFVATGKANFTDLANSIIKDLARIFARQALFQALSLIPGVGNFLGLTKSASTQSPDPLTKDFLIAGKGAAFAKNKIVPYAMGGIVTRPTLFQYANGGSGRFGLMGEAGAEAIMPLRRGSNGKLGVEASGAGMGNITVNVDAAGSSVEGDASQANQLGKAIGVAVQQELIKQKRPGGLLAS